MNASDSSAIISSATNSKISDSKDLSYRKDNAMLVHLFIHYYSCSDTGTDTVIAVMPGMIHLFIPPTPHGMIRSFIISLPHHCPYHCLQNGVAIPATISVTHSMTHSFIYSFMSFPPECLLNGGAIPAALSVMYGMIHLFIHSFIQSFIHHFPTIVS